MTQGSLGTLAVVSQVRDLEELNGVCVYNYTAQYIAHCIAFSYCLL